MSRNFGKVQEPPPEERKLFGLVLMLREWVERSFCAEQEERLNAKGRLCARFQVDLGEEMTKQLQNYVAASLPLRLINIRVVKHERPSKHPQECAEVVMSPEARAVYAEKCPGAVAKYRAQLSVAKSATGIVEGDLVDANGDEDEDDAWCRQRLAIGMGQPASNDRQLSFGCGHLALESGPKALHDGQPALKDSQLAVPPVSPPEKAHLSKCISAHASTTKQSKRKASSELDATQSKRKSDKVVPAVNLADMNADSKPAKAVAEVSGTGSVWEQCEAHIVPAGIDGLVEAKNALDEGLARIEAGGLVALKAEKDLVAWLKGLSVCEVGATGLQATKIGLSVNECRKHPEPYISGLAISLLKPWVRAWRESEKSHSQRN